MIARPDTKAVVFDVGETLVDETGMWERAADAAGVPRFTLMGVLGGLAARGEHHSKVWKILDVEWPGSTWTLSDFYADALPCLAGLRARGLLVGAAGNIPAECEDLLREHVDFVGSSGRWGIEKPALEFFERIVAEAGVGAEEIAYVGDRVDNDVRPASSVGMIAVHIRRGPWGYLEDGGRGGTHMHQLTCAAAWNPGTRLSNDARMQDLTPRRQTPAVPGWCQVLHFVIARCDEAS